MLPGIGAAIASAFAVHEIGEFVEKMAELAEKALHVADALGLEYNQFQQKPVGTFTRKK